MKYDVCVFGGCSLDQIYYQNVDGTYPQKPSLKVPGGKGANQAVAASRAGAKTCIISKIGNDEIGREIIDNLRDNLIDISGIEIVDNLKNDYSNIYISIKDKDNDIERFNGAINSFTQDMVDKYAQIILNSRIIVCQLKIPKEVTEKLIKFCNDNNKFLILTPCRPEKLSINDSENIELINKISLITCNEKECKTIFNTDKIEECVKNYPNKLIVTLGENGLLFSNGKRIIKMPAIKIDKLIDTIGAGDTLNGNLAAFLSKNIDLEHALRKAMYASAMKIQVKSAQNGMPFIDELDKFISITRNKRFEYGKELNYALKIVKDAYENSKTNKEFNISLKNNNTLVTDIDLYIEDYLISNIKKEFTQDKFLTEERNSKAKLANRTWIIDPIDGTSHFIKDSIFWGIQLAFFDENETKFAIIYLPKLNEFYYGAKNQGVYLNNNKLFQKFDNPLDQTIVEFGGSLSKQLKSKKIYFSKLIKANESIVGNILHINSCCISFSNLISGKTDALIISSHNPWDVMPGKFLCKEAGISSIALDFENNLMLYSKNKEITNILLK